MIDPRPNPLFERPDEAAGNHEAVRRAHVKLVAKNYRDIRDLRRKQTAREAIAGLARDGGEIFGLTKGQFSLVDLLEAALELTGPAHLNVSTWTAANTDISKALELIASGKILTARWLVDLTFVRRCPQLAARIREAFGPDCIRVTKNHAKFSTLTNDGWSVAIRTSMNLNHNPRLEDFTIAHDPPLVDFLRQALDDIWASQRRSMASDATFREMGAWWETNG